MIAVPLWKCSLMQAEALTVWSLLHRISLHHLLPAQCAPPASVTSYFEAVVFYLDHMMLHRLHISVIVLYLSVYLYLHLITGWKVQSASKDTGELVRVAWRDSGAGKLYFWWHEQNKHNSHCGCWLPTSCHWTIDSRHTAIYSEDTWGLHFFLSAVK